jgi:hypothetical protein
MPRKNLYAQRSPTGQLASSASRACMLTSLLLVRSVHATLPGLLHAQLHLQAVAGPQHVHTLRSSYQSIAHIGSHPLHQGQSRKLHHQDDKL